MTTERIVWWLAVGCAGLVMLGSFSASTSRTYGQPGSQPFTIATESALRWQVWTLLLGVLAIIMLEFGRRARPQVNLAALSAVTSAVALCLVVMVAGQKWVALIEESSQRKRYTLDVADGLPLVVLAAVPGVTLAAVLAMSWKLQLVGTRERAKPLAE